MDSPGMRDDELGIGVVAPGENARGLQSSFAGSGGCYIKRELAPFFLCMFDRIELQLWRTA
jgi:hypothetical protein